MRRGFVLPVLIGTLLAAGCQPQPAPAPAAATIEAPFAYAEASIADLGSLMSRGELDSRTLTRAYLQRITAIDQDGPQLRSVLELNPQAMQEAATLDAERSAGHLRGPLHGIPVLLKDNIDATPMSTSAGSLALADFHPRHDAFLVQRLRRAGALILGKSNLSEWANFRSPHALSGWSGRGGQTRNPYDLQRTPCGSSSGSAVAVAANLTAVAVGTETDGSIVCPAAVNGIVGLKPTVGLVSRSGILPISFSQDTAGPMARSVADAALLLTALVGRDESDPATASMPGRAVYDYSARLNVDGLRGARIGLLRNRLSEQPDIGVAMDNAVQVLRDAGATVIEVELVTEGQWSEPELTVLLYEFKAGLEKYLGRQQAPIRSLAQLIEFNRRQYAKEQPLFGQELFEQAQAKGGLGESEYIQARTSARLLAGAQGIDATLQAGRLDALVAPTTGAAWKIVPGQDDDFPGGNYSAAAVAGYPSLSVPMGHSNGLPLGLLFMGTAWSEPRLIELGYAYEQRTRARRPPQLGSDAAAASGH